MKELTKQMIEDFRIKELGYDMMGYSKQEGDLYNFHHLIIPRRNCERYGIDTGYYKWNGAILFTTPHEYLHIIETRDEDIFLAITSEMIDMNIKGYLDKQNLKYIDDCLKEFERGYCSDKTKKGKPLIKEQYLKRNIF